MHSTIQSQTFNTRNIGIAERNVGPSPTRVSVMSLQGRMHSLHPVAHPAGSYAVQTGCPARLLRRVPHSAPQSS